VLLIELIFVWTVLCNLVVASVVLSVFNYFLFGNGLYNIIPCFFSVFYRYGLRYLMVIICVRICIYFIMDYNLGN